MKKVYAILMSLLAALTTVAGNIDILFEKPSEWTGTPKLYFYNNKIWEWDESPEAVLVKDGVYRFQVSDAGFNENAVPANYIIFDSADQNKRVEKYGFVNGRLYNGDGVTATTVDQWLDNQGLKPVDPSWQSELYLTGNRNNWQIGAATVKVPHVGDGIYTVTLPFVSGEDDLELFKVSKTDTADWIGFDSGVFQPADPSAIGVERSYTFGFTDNLSVSACSEWTLTVNMADGTIRVDARFNAKMPLNENDFANGRKHYFIVGSRTNDFRLQPEWELAANGSTATLADRLVYPGMIGVAVVDNYADYIFHRFNLYVKLDGAGNGEVIAADNHADIVLGNAGRAVCIPTENYRDNVRPYHYLKADNTTTAMLFNWNRATDVAREILLGKPVLVGEIKLTLDNEGVPTAVSFDDCSTDPSAIASKMVFSPCGSHIFYDDRSVFDPTKGTTYWSRDEGYFHTTDAWANSWVQYGADFKPYVDGYGRYLSQTVYQYDEWLREHPTRFKYEALGSMPAMPYSSNDILFVHYQNIDPEEDPYYQYYLSRLGDDVAIGAARERKNLEPGEGFFPWYFNEQLYSFNPDGTTEKLLEGQTRVSSNWQPYVISDIWIFGQFKIWSGTSGGPRYQARADESEPGIYNDFLWFPDNGGVDLNQNTYGVVSSTSIFHNADAPIEGKIFTLGQHDAHNNYEFVGSPRYFKRVILWYDADRGISNSLLQFIVRDFAPTIAVANHDESHLKYQWEIPHDSQSLVHNATLNSFTIERYRIADDGTAVFHGYARDADGNDVRDRAVDCLIKDIHANGEFISLHSGVDNTPLPSGTYFYKVKTAITDNTNPEESRYLAREAASTRATILSSVEPEQTGVENVGVDNQPAPVYYDLSGRRVDNPADGLFVRVAGGKAVKVRL